MPTRRDPRLYIDDVLEAIANIEILPEASRRIPNSLKAAEPSVPWRKIAGIGNVLRHDYGGLRPEILWGIRTNRLAALKSAVERIRKRLGQ
jgi:uncharacterized protein with HEPN domain